MKKTLKTKFAVSNGNGFHELRKAHSLSELIESLPKRLQRWGSIEFRNEDGDRVVVDKAIMEDANWTLEEVMNDWLTFATEDDKHEDIIATDMSKPFREGRVEL